MKVEREEFDFDEFFEYLQRRRKKTYRQLTPTELKNRITDGLMRRIDCQCRKQRYAVISCCKDTRSKNSNFVNQHRMAKRIVMMGFSYTPVISFWEKINSRSLFIPLITHGMARKIAGEFGQTHYVVGCGGHWRKFQTADNTVSGEGFGLKIINVDFEFYLYVRIHQRRNVIRRQIAWTKGHKKLNHHQRIGELRRRLADLRIIEKEMMC